MYFTEFRSGVFFVLLPFIILEKVHLKFLPLWVRSIKLGSSTHAFSEIFPNETHNNELLDCWCLVKNKQFKLCCKITLQKTSPPLSWLSNILSLDNKDDTHQSSGLIFSRSFSVFSPLELIVCDLFPSHNREVICDTGTLIYSHSLFWNVLNFSHITVQMLHIFTKKGTELLLQESVACWFARLNLWSWGACLWFPEPVLIFFFLRRRPSSWQLKSHDSGWERRPHFWRSSSVLICWCQWWFLTVVGSVLTGCSPLHQLYYFSHCTLLLIQSLVQFLQGEKNKYFNCIQNCLS